MWSYFVVKPIGDNGHFDYFRPRNWLMISKSRCIYIWEFKKMANVENDEKRIIQFGAISSGLQPYLNKIIHLFHRIFRHKLWLATFKIYYFLTLPIRDNGS